jgi:hypothetical protein
VYFDAAATNKLYNHSDYYENSNGTDKILRDLSNKASIVLTPTAYSNGSLNTVIPPYQVLPTELVTNGDFATDSDWNLGTGWSIANGVAEFNGTTAAISQNIGLITNKIYQITFTVNINQGGIAPVLGGSVQLNTITTSGTHTVQSASGVNSLLYFQPVNFNSQDFQGSIDNVSVKEIQEADFDFSRGSSATRVNEKGLIEDVASGIPRIDYTSGTGALLLEPQSTNSVTYSNDFSNSDWIKQSGISSTYNTTETLSPEGLNNASKFTGNGTNGVYRQAIVTGVVTRSIYLKSVTGNVSVIIKDPVLTVTTKTLNLNETWQRFELIESNGHGLLSGIWIDDIPASGIYMYGAQVEAGSYATSYIPTEGSTVTRSADVANNSGNADLFNDSEGVLYAEISGFVNGSGGDRTISISDGSTQNALQLLLHNTANRINFRLRSGGSLDVNISDFTFEQNEINKIACKYKSGDYALWINGEEKATSTSSSLPSGLSELAFDDGSFNDFYGNTKELAVFKEALTDAELQKLTS